MAAGSAMDYNSPTARITRFFVYLFAVSVPMIIGLAVVGTTPYLLDKVPEQHRDTVAAIGDGAVLISGGNGGLFGSGGAEANAANTAVPGAVVPRRGEWSPRRPEDYPPPAGLTAGLDYSVDTTEDGYVSHWPCEHEIPVRSYEAPPGSETDLAWAVETLAFASGLPLALTGQANPFNGPTQVVEGTLQLASAQALAHSAVTLADQAGVSLQLLADSTVASLSGTGAVNGTVDLGSFTLSTGDASDTGFAGVIGGAGGLVKQGSGRFTLSGISVAGIGAAFWGVVAGVVTLAVQHWRPTIRQP